MRKNLKKCNLMINFAIENNIATKLPITEFNNLCASSS